jgi:actin-binding protein anillin
LLNRFHNKNNKTEIPLAPPMPPPDFFDTQTRRQSHHIEANTVVINNKRRSDERSLDEPEGGSRVSPEVRSTLDDVKRIRVAAPKDGRLYPTLSDIESTATESDNDNYTTATASGTDEQLDVEREYRFHEQQQPARGDDDYTDNENDDRWVKCIDILLFCLCVN